MHRFKHIDSRSVNPTSHDVTSNHNPKSIDPKQQTITSNYQTSELNMKMPKLPKEKMSIETMKNFKRGARISQEKKTNR